jgi:Ca-activated chloride channel family protein
MDDDAARPDCHDVASVGLMSASATKEPSMHSAPARTVTFAVALLVVACGGGTATPTPPPPTAPPATAGAPTEAPQATTAVPTGASTGEPSVKAPAQVAAGTPFEIEWTGPNADKDYVTVVAAGATKWTNEPFFYTQSNPSPARLTAPGTPGAYELWYVSGVSEAILARTSIAVNAFTGSIVGPATVEAGSVFEVTWTGPNGPNDYVTIVKVGATSWTNESYFNTSIGPKGTLSAPLEAGAYELWYVTGAGEIIQLRVPITVTPYTATVDGPGQVGRSQPVTIAWTGPNGLNDYITIAPAGSPEGTYLNYCNTSSPSPCIINAPDNAGEYEIRYVAGTGKTLATEPLLVK